MRLTVRYTIFFSLFATALFSQMDRFGKTNIAALDQLFEKHYDYVAQVPQEKVYLHLDKPFYSSEETMWFRAYVLEGLSHQPTPWSNILYVDLIAENRGVVATKKIEIENGAAFGEIELGEDVTTGTYLLRAYTSWMRNFDEALFFNQSIPIYNVDNEINWRLQQAVVQRENGSVVKLRIQLSNLNDVQLSQAQVSYAAQLGTGALITKNMILDNEGEGEVELFFPDNNEDDWSEIELTAVRDGKIYRRNIPIDLRPKTNVEFFPEGGDLINGLRSRVAFKAVAKNGRSVPVKGTIVNQKGEEVARFKSEHLGMGSFYFTPVVGDTYTAVLDKYMRRIPLPLALRNGSVMRVESVSEKLVRVNVKTGADADKLERYLVTQAKGEIISAIRIPAEQLETSIKISRDEIPAGIVQFTLFDASQQPLAERIIFNNNGASQLDFTVSPQQNDYRARDEITLDISTAREALTDFSIAVRDVKQVNTDGYYESNIWRHVLLESEVKGYIEEPAYYFAENNSRRRYALDLLLMTQGWRRYDLTETTAKELPVTDFAIERGLYVSGQVLDKKYNLQNYFLSAVATQGFPFTEMIELDTSGLFYFPFPAHSDTVELVFQTNNSKGKKRNLL
ncbi:MAG: hypothetical protein AB8G22_16260, partial [Saprospiraceae bacterium]